MKRAGHGLETAREIRGECVKPSGVMKRVERCDGIECLVGKHGLVHVDVDEGVSRANRLKQLRQRQVIRDVERDAGQPAL